MKVKHILLLVFVTCLFSFNLPIGKLVLETTSPLMTQTLKSLVTALLIAPFLRKLPRRYLADAFILALLLFSVCHTLASTAIKASHNLNLMGFLNMLESPLAAIFGFVFLGERFTRAKGAGLMICVLALWLACRPRYDVESTAIALMLASILCGAFGKLLLRKRVMSCCPTQLMLWAFFFSSLQYTAGTFLFDAFLLPGDPRIYLGISSMAVFGIVYFVVMSHLQKLYTVSRLSPLALLTLFTLPAANYLVLGEEMTLNDLTACLVLFVGLAFFVVKGKFGPILGERAEPC